MVAMKMTAREREQLSEALLVKAGEQIDVAAQMVGQAKRSPKAIRGQIELAMAILERARNWYIER